MTLTPASSVDEIVAYLQSLRNEANIAGMARFGIDTTTALGITTPQMQRLAEIIDDGGPQTLPLREPDVPSLSELYLRYGFADCAPFGAYQPDPNSRYMTRLL